jgi:predicted DCC family thiol-disulfide oxidoreductase YuxK
MKTTGKDILTRIFSLDLRSLALMRVMYGMLLLFDLYNRARYLTADYTDVGVLPRDVAVNYYSNPWMISVHLLNGSWEVQAILFIIAAIFAGMLLVGYRTRLATIISWILLISLQTRNPLILQGGDVLLRVGLFWAMFLPWGKYFSVDSVLKPRKPAESSIYLSGATVAYILQIAIVYWFAALFKFPAVEWIREGSAIYYALSIDQLTNWLGHILLKFKTVMKIMTFGSLGLEAFGPFLFFIPVYTDVFRLIGALSFIFFHLGLSASMHLGPFPWVGITTAIALLPPLFWNLLEKWLVKRTAGYITIYYDSECGFCKKTVTYLQTFFILPYAKIRPAAEDDSIFSDMVQQNSWIVVDNEGTRHYKFAGVIAVVAASPILGIFSSILKLSAIRKLGTKIYEYVAAHRRNQCIPTVGKPPAQQQNTANMLKKVAGSGITLLLIGYVFLWNVNEISPQLKLMPIERQSLALLLRLDQRWNMFSPYPLKEDGWYVMPGHLRDGTVIDVFQNGAPINWQKPENVAAMYDGERWRKYLMNLWYQGYAYYRKYYGEYVCRSWNETHTGSEQLRDFDMVFMKEVTLPNYQESTPEPVTILQQTCPLDDTSVSFAPRQ